MDVDCKYPIQIEETDGVLRKQLRNQVKSNGK
jgi:hypothetical protein